MAFILTALWPVLTTSRVARESETSQAHGRIPCRSTYRSLSSPPCGHQTLQMSPVNYLSERGPPGWANKNLSFGTCLHKKIYSSWIGNSNATGLYPVFDLATLPRTLTTADGYTWHSISKGSLWASETFSDLPKATQQAKQQSWDLCLGWACHRWYVL